MTGLLSQMRSPIGGLTCQADSVGLDAVVWFAPPGTAGELVVNSGSTSAGCAPELLWSTKAAMIPATRAIVLLGGPGCPTVSTGFEFAHHAAERIAKLAARPDDEVGPIEVLVFRPEVRKDFTSTNECSTGEAWPEPTVTESGVVFAFTHHGGDSVRLRLSVPRVIAGNPVRQSAAHTAQHIPLILGSD